MFYTIRTLNLYKLYRPFFLAFRALSSSSCLLSVSGSVQYCILYPGLFHDLLLPRHGYGPQSTLGRYRCLLRTPFCSSDPSSSVRHASNAEIRYWRTMACNLSRDADIAHFFMRDKNACQRREESSAIGGVPPLLRNSEINSQSLLLTFFFNVFV